jgi:hypothetical protein
LGKNDKTQTKIVMVEIEYFCGDAEATGSESADQPGPLWGHLGAIFPQAGRRRKLAGGIAYTHPILSLDTAPIFHRMTPMLRQLHPPCEFIFYICGFSTRAPSLVFKSCSLSVTILQLTTFVSKPL